MTIRSQRPGSTPGVGAHPPRTSRWRGRPARGGLLAVLLCALLLVVACTPPDLPPPVSPSASEGDPGPSPRDDQTLVIGVDGTVTGFNPYVAAQYSLAGRAVANLVLPSVFPPGGIGPETSSTALVDKVEVTSLAPFTVTYTLNKSAAWADGTPIAAEDFTYLWQQMVSQPGVVDPGGYRLITDIRSADAGKTVIVEFVTQYGDWRSLFSPLLPARTLKDQPGGFLGALADGIPVSGSSYKLKSFDPINGEIVLARNDKYWGPEPGPVEVTFRIGPAEELADAVHRGDIDAAYLQPDPATLIRLRADNAADKQFTVPLPQVDRIDFALDSAVTSNLAVRRGIALALNLDQLATAWSQGRVSGFTRVGSMVSLPATQAPTTAALPLTGTAADAFAEAGYTRPGLYYSRDDQTLRVTVGYPVEDVRSTAAARELQRQLGRAGVLVDLIGLSTADLIDPGVAPVPADLIVHSVPRGASDSAVAAAALGCSAPAVGPELLPLCPASADGGIPSMDSDVVALLAGVSGAGAMSNTPTLMAAREAVDAALWDQLPYLPVAEPAAVFVIAGSVSHLLVDDDPLRLLWGGPLVDLPTWTLPG
ncbi:hypothetical protein D1871_05495 [Nakamurella silvestris]|nr:hypothetical protein D1871_05495 [Nakamurella silvestris]